jgi:hypothetical protein
MHGGESMTDPENRCEWFADGARIDQWGLHEPPTEASDLLRAKRRFIALKLSAEEEAFNNFRKECAEQLSIRQRYGSVVPPPPADWEGQLESGSQRVEQLREQLASLDREISELPEEQARRAFFEQRRQQSDEAQRALTKLRGLTI